MKTKTTVKKLLKKTGLFSIFLLLITGIPHLAFSQDAPINPSPNKLPIPAPDAPIHNKIEPAENPSPNFSPAKFFPPDFVDSTLLNKTKKNIYYPITKTDAGAD